MGIRLEGRPVARGIRRRLRGDIELIATQVGRQPATSAVLVGQEPSSVAYFRSMRRSFEKLRIDLNSVMLPEDVSADRLAAELTKLNHDAGTDGIIVFQPLPPRLPPSLVSKLLSPDKDIDGATPDNAGRLALGLPCFLPSTPAGGIEILRHYEVPVSGKSAVVIGRSPVVGMPMALLLLAENATVTVCHSRTPDIAEISREADIIALAVGKPGLLTPGMVKEGAVVIDFGVSVVDGELIGDAARGVEDVAGAMTPVPGGTGVVTIAILARNTMWAAARAAGLTEELPLESDTRMLR
jgi:methylenetetrahydrofolate dehydrogenase (NADP+) / methenyltetrahydrofolate cyclohydrolase